MSDTRWFRFADLEFEVEAESLAFKNLVADGAEMIPAPDAKPAAAAKRSRKAADDDGEDTLGE